MFAGLDFVGVGIADRQYLHEAKLILDQLIFDTGDTLYVAQDDDAPRLGHGELQLQQPGDEVRVGELGLPFLDDRRVTEEHHFESFATRFHRSRFQHIFWDHLGYIRLEFVDIHDDHGSESTLHHSMNSTLSKYKLMNINIVISLK